MEKTKQYNAALHRTLALSLLAGLGRLAIASAIGAGLLLFLVNEIVTTLVYTLAALLMLFFGSCLH